MENAFLNRNLSAEAMPNASSVWCAKTEGVFRLLTPDMTIMKKQFHKKPATAIRIRQTGLLLTKSPPVSLSQAIAQRI
jgi:hypothetical protein